uniref:Pr1-like protein n=1 Tax=Oryza sativa subsp. japonica TaxID=39947 RepID=Q65WS5_ORYSJ|nr:hypothetical protein [Oryza sativa Japonica Group]
MNRVPTSWGFVYPRVNKDEDRAARGRDPYHHATRRGNDNDERARRRRPGTTGTNGEGTTSAAILGRRRDAAGTRPAHLTNADDGRERLDGGTNATTTGNDGRTTTTTTGASEETTRAAGGSCTETGTTDVGDDEDGEASTGDGVPAKQRSSWRRGQRGDVDRRTGDVQEPAGGGEVLDADEEATPASFGRGGGDAGDEGGVAEPREVVATSAGARETRQWRPEVEQWRQRHCFAGEDASPRADRGRGGGCEAEEGDGTAGRRSGKAVGAAGGVQRHGRERATAGRARGNGAHARARARHGREGAARVGPGGRPRRRGGGGGLGRAGREGRGGKRQPGRERGEGAGPRGRGAQEEGEKEWERKRGRKRRLRPRAEGREGGLWAKIGPKEKEDYF